MKNMRREARRIKRRTGHRQGNKLTMLAVSAAALVGAGMAVMTFPEVRRYLRIKRM